MTMTMTKFNSMADVMAVNKHWFSANNMRFFRSKVHGELHGGKYFVSSEQFVDSRGKADLRRYTVRMIDSKGGVETWHPTDAEGKREGDGFQMFDSEVEAHTEIDRLLRVEVGKREAEV